MASITSPKHHKAVTISDGTTYAYLFIEASRGKPTILFLHGFPSSSYDFRHQVVDFHNAGYGVLVPDLLGYGGTDKPVEKEAYALRRMACQVMQLLDEENLKQVVAVGHDWGSLFLSRLANWHPNRFLAYVFLSVGYIQPGPRIDIDAINSHARSVVGYNIFGYWPFFNSEEAADIIERNLTSFHTITYPADPWIWKTHIGPAGAYRKWLDSGELADRPSWQSAEEDEIHSGILKSGGLTGPLNWYKQELGGCNESDNAEITEADKQLQAPTLLIACEKDAVCPPVFQEEDTKPFAKDLRIINFDCGHWVQLEMRKEMFSALDSFITDKVKV